MAIAFICELRRSFAYLGEQKNVTHELIHDCWTIKAYCEILTFMADTRAISTKYMNNSEISDKILVIIK